MSRMIKQNVAVEMAMKWMTFIQMSIQSADCCFLYRYHLSGRKTITGAFYKSDQDAIMVDTLTEANNAKPLNVVKFPSSEIHWPNVITAWCKSMYESKYETFC